MGVETQSARPVPGTATIEALLRAGVRLLEPTSASPRLDAELLLGWALGRSRAALFARREAVVEPAATTRYLDAIHARQAGQPVAQLVGRREFWSLDLAVTADVLIPRPETELAVEHALRHLPPGGRVLDLGTGSGAIALAIATERRDTHVLATDCSAAALAIARQNAGALGLDNVAFASGDWYAAVPGGRFELIVANPPYLAEAELAAAGPELGFEPRAALVSGHDGLDAIRRIVAGARAHLAADGWLVLEHGATQGEATRMLCTAAGLAAVATARDLAGLPRITEGRRPASDQP